MITAIRNGEREIIYRLRWGQWVTRIVTDLRCLSDARSIAHKQLVKKIGPDGCIALNVRKQVPYRSGCLYSGKRLIRGKLVTMPMPEKKPRDSRSWKPAAGPRLDTELNSWIDRMLREDSRQ